LEQNHFLAFDDELHRYLAIDRNDVTVFSVDWLAIADSLSKHAGLVRSLETIICKSAWHLATKQTQLGDACPIFLGRGLLQASLLQIRNQTDRPFVLLRLRSKTIDPICSKLLQEQRGIVLSLPESTQIGESQEIVFSQSALERMRRVGTPSLSKSAANKSTNCFPTPPGCAWSAIKVRFLDMETVSISAAGIVGRYHYSEMGFANLNNKRPSVQWELLRAFARGYGTLTWDSPGANRKNQKRRERLSAVLNDFFGLPDDPIHWMADQCGWQTKFVLEPER
jgi:hypothetical protein